MSLAAEKRMRFRIESIFYVYERRLQVFVCVVKETEKMRVRVGEKGEVRETEHGDVNTERERERYLQPVYSQRAGPPPTFLPLFDVMKGESV